MGFWGDIYYGGRGYEGIIMDYLDISRLVLACLFSIVYTCVLP
jgi:hypothetical protein